MSSILHKTSKSLSYSQKKFSNTKPSKMYTKLNPSIKDQFNKSQGDKSHKIQNKSRGTASSGNIAIKRKKILSIGNSIVDDNKSSIIEQSNNKINTESSVIMNNNKSIMNCNNIRYNNNSLNKSCCFTNSNNNYINFINKKEPHKIKPYYDYEDKTKNDNNTYLTIPISLFKELELKMSYKMSENKSNSKSVKYNTTKSILEELIKYFPKEGQTLLINLLKNYHEVVTAFLNENRKFQEQNQMFTNKYFYLEKENIYLKKKVKELDFDLETLKKKNFPLSKEQLMLFSKSTNETVVSNGGNALINIKEQHFNDRREYINDLNKHNLEDLDAIYFYDKVKMNEEGGEPVDTKGKPVPNLNLFSNKYVNK